jgi:hypothetical protein
MSHRKSDLGIPLPHTWLNPSTLPNREFYREFFSFAAKVTILPYFTRETTMAYSEIPYSKEQGIIFADQGIFQFEQGIRIAFAITASPIDLLVVRYPILAGWCE